MVHSTAATVEQYLGEMDDSRRLIISEVRSAILENLPRGYVESMNWGMIAYEIPLSVCPDTYNGQPLLYCALAAQKRHNAVYFMGIYADSELEGRLVDGYRRASLKLDMGKRCVRFKTLADVDLGIVGEILAATSVEDFVAHYAATRGRK